VTHIDWDKSYQGDEYIVMHSKAGCPVFSVNQMFIFFHSIRIFLGIVLVPAGGFILVKGRDKIHISIGLSLFVCIHFAYMFVIYHIFLANSRLVWIDWVNFVVWAILAGGTTYYLTTKKLKIGVFVQAAFAGFVVALLFCTALQLPVVAILYVVMVLFGGLNCFGLHKRPNLGMIVNSSILGSFFVVRGLTLVLGPSLTKMPNEFTIADQLQADAIGSVPWQFYPVFGSILVLAVAGGFFQVRQMKEESFDFVHFYHLV